MVLFRTIPSLVTRKIAPPKRARSFDELVRLGRIPREAGSNDELLVVSVKKPKTCPG
jgi:hypothetical protein